MQLIDPEHPQPCPQTSSGSYAIQGEIDFLVRLAPRQRVGMMGGLLSRSQPKVRSLRMKTRQAHEPSQSGGG